jgi:putative ABC transport system ATP-binding protein
VLKLLYDLSRKQDTTVIIITHNQAIAPMADRIIRIRSGKIESNERNEHVIPIEEIEW